uniref:(northern house mosquito) hypothetical protein n=1 Tax=Culex pipiens TaxID=7175 RepID=A0A8D8G750_CULPI
MGIEWHLHPVVAAVIIVFIIIWTPHSSTSLLPQEDRCATWSKNLLHNTRISSARSRPSEGANLRGGRSPRHSLPAPKAYCCYSLTGQVDTPLLLPTHPPFERLGMHLFSSSQVVATRSTTGHAHTNKLRRFTRPTVVCVRRASIKVVLDGSLKIFLTGTLIRLVDTPSLAPSTNHSHSQPRNQQAAPVATSDGGTPANTQKLRPFGRELRHPCPHPQDDDDRDHP